MKIGIYGGTFDPPHIGHINALKAFVDAFDFDKVFVIPVFMPPHKNQHSQTSPTDRLNMSKLAFEPLSEKVIVSDMEIKREGKSYTVDTIRSFKEMGYDDIYFLCGTDMILTLGNWYNPAYIFENASIVYARRENDREISIDIEGKIKEYKEKFGAKIFNLNIEVLEASSTEIREDLCKGSTSFLTSDVISYIKKQGLYCNE